MAEWLVAALVVIAVLMLATGLGHARRRGWQRIVIDAPAQRIWGVLTDYARIAQWQPGVEEIEVQPGAGAWTQRHKDGLTCQYATEEAVAPRRIRWRYVAIAPGAERSEGARGTWTLHLRERSGRCVVRSRAVDRAGGLWSRLVSALRGPASHQRLYLECLKARAEQNHDAADLPPKPA